MFFAALFYFFIAVFFIQLAYYSVFTKLFFLKTHRITDNNEGVSIIICAHNEAHNLKTHLDSILSQNYPEFEVIVVNDASTDNSASILNGLQKKHNKLKVITIESSITYLGNKKNAITLGIQAASHELLLFTDADCQPISSYWISELASHFKNDISIVLGYGGYQKIKYSLLNKIIRYETLLTATQYFSYASNGLPYMGVGRNLAYRKSLFQKFKGFQKHKNIRSGDDDLFVNQTANKHNTAICLSERSFTISKPKTTFRNWFIQKRRHITTAVHYKPIYQFLLGIFYTSQFLFWFLAIILLAFSFNWQFVTVLITIRLISQYIILGNSAKMLKESDLILFLPFLDFMLVATQLVIYFSNLISKPTSW